MTVATILKLYVFSLHNEQPTETSGYILYRVKDAQANDVVSKNT